MRSGLRQLWLHRDPAGAGHPLSHPVFLSRCSLTSEQVRKHYLSGGPEAHESTGIIFVETQVQSDKPSCLEARAGACRGLAMHYPQVLAGSQFPPEAQDLPLVQGKGPGTCSAP